MNDMLVIAALIAMYVVGAEDNIPDLQRDVADQFCNLIKLDAIEFNKLGLKLENS